MVSLSSGGEGGKPEVVPMKVVDVSTPSDEAFVVEAIMPQEGVSIEVGDNTLLLERVLGMDSMPAINLYVEIVNVVNSPTTDQ